MSATRRIGLVLLTLAALAAPAWSQRVEPSEASILALRQAVTFSESGMQHPRLVALRALRDPATRPIFEALMKAEQPPLRLDGLLGLAELAGEAGADPELVRAMGDPAMRTVAITQCLGLSLLKPPAIRAMLGWSDLPAYDRALLVAELNRLHEPWDVALLQDASDSAMAEVASLAALLRLERGDDAAWRKVQGKLADASPSDRADLLRNLCNAARHYELKAAVAPLLEATAGSKGADRVAAVAAAVALQPAAGRAAMLDLWKAERSSPNAIQCGLVMLAANDAFEAADFTSLQGVGATSDAISRAGVALRTPGADRAAPLLELLLSGNRPAAEWAIQELAKLPPEVRRAPLLQVIDRLDTLDTPSMQDKLLAALAAQKLVASDADELSRRITRRQARADLEESITTAMCDLGTPEAAAFARMVRGKLSQRGDSMALVAIARTADGMNPIELRELGRIGGGGGRVDEPIQMQAAWLYLRHANKLAEALPRLTKP